jgi:NDP-sugar pyrophosphorylase family protein
MKAMILAAGFGTRLRPLTNEIPKPLLPVAGRPLIVWNLLLLKQHGITEIIINLHHLGHLIEKELGNGSALGMRLTYSHEPVILGTGGGIKQAEAFFDRQPVLVMNADTLLELDLSELIRAHQARQPIATLVLRADPDAETWGPVEVDARQQVLRINKKGVLGVQAAATYMFAGVHVLDPRVLADVPSGRETSIIDAYVRALARGETIGGFPMTGYWSDIGTPDRYAEAQRDAEAGLIDLAARARVLAQ